MKKIHISYFLSLVILCLGCNMAHPVTPTYIAERGISSPMFGYAFSAAMLTMFLTSPLYGKLCNYYATKKILVLTTLGYCLGQFFFFLARSDAAMFSARLFAGLFSGGMWTAALNYIVNTSEDEERGRNLTIFVTVQSVFNAMGFFLGGVLGEITTETALLAQVGTLLLSALLFFFVCVDDTDRKERPETPLRVKDVNPFSAFLDVRKYTTGLLTLLFLITVIANTGVITFEQEFNFYIMDHFHLTSGYNGAFKAAIAIVSFIVNSTVSLRLMKKTNVNFVALPVLICCAVPLGMILLFDNIVPFVVMDVTFYAFNAIRLPILQNQISDVAPIHYRNNAMGFYQSMTCLGSFLGGMFAGSLYMADKRLPFLVAFGTFCVASAIGLLYLKKYRRQNPGTTLKRKK